MRYKLSDFFWLHPFVLFSVGLVFTLVNLTELLFEMFKLSSLVAIISDALGGLDTRTRHYMIVNPMDAFITGFLVGGVILLLVRLRRKLASLLAFSLPLSWLLLECLRLWIYTVPLTPDTLMLAFKLSVLPSLIAATLFLLLVFRYNTAVESHTKEGLLLTCWPTRGEYYRLGIYAVYFLVCAYGWYAILLFRAHMLLAKEYWNQVMPVE